MRRFKNLTMDRVMKLMNPTMTPFIHLNRVATQENETCVGGLCDVVYRGWSLFPYTYRFRPTDVSIKVYSTPHDPCISRPQEGKTPLRT
jgi:hypothetical protein